MTLMYCDVGNTSYKTAQVAPPHSCRVPGACELPEKAVPPSRPETATHPWEQWPFYEVPQEVLEAIQWRGAYHLHWTSPSLLSEHIKNID